MHRHGQVHEVKGVQAPHPHEQDHQEQAPDAWQRGRACGRRPTSEEDAEAGEGVDKALNYAFVGRRRKKRDFRQLWVVRINAAARINGLSYGRLINGLKAANIGLDRKSLAELAVNHPEAFAKVAAQAAAAAPAPTKAPKASATA